MVTLAVAVVLCGGVLHAMGSALIARQPAFTQIWGGFNITIECLNVQAAISSPTCNVTQPCVQYTTQVIPQCLALHGDPGCWCANPDPLHYCALCMTNPTDNTTTPQQTQLSTISHANYHTGCGAYQRFLNDTFSGILSPTSSILSTTSTSSTSSSSPTASAIAANTSSNNISNGALAGVIIGGIIGILLIAVAGLITYRYIQNQHQERSTQLPGSHGPYYGSGMPESKYQSPQQFLPALPTDTTIPAYNATGPPRLAIPGGSPPPPLANYVDATQNTAPGTYAQSPTNDPRNSLLSNTTSQVQTRPIEPNRRV
ncbi:hypothetical protein FRB99_000848 [Tulasnella sp. 403]|nr:hypothetical protein FRB99_000848 [Tulasnella sp. 403]